MGFGVKTGAGARAETGAGPGALRFPAGFREGGRVVPFALVWAARLDTDLFAGLIFPVASVIAGLA